MSLEEFEDNLDPNAKRQIHRRSIMDIGMGLIYIVVAGVLLFAKQLQNAHTTATSI